MTESSSLIKNLAAGFTDRLPQVALEFGFLGSWCGFHGDSQPDWFGGVDLPKNTALGLSGQHTCHSSTAQQAEQRQTSCRSLCRMAFRSCSLLALKQLPIAPRFDLLILILSSQNHHRQACGGRLRLASDYGPQQSSAKECHSDDGAE